MRLFEQAKRFGIWNPGDLDFRQDAQDWQRLAPDERDILLRLARRSDSGNPGDHR
jgi:ribonucleoside-diphosphate reductase beta chain